MKTVGLESLLFSAPGERPRYQTEDHGAFNGDLDLKNRIIDNLTEDWTVKQMIEDAGGFFSRAETDADAFYRIYGFPEWMVHTAAAADRKDGEETRETLKELLAEMRVGGRLPVESVSNLVGSVRIYDVWEVTDSRTDDFSEEERDLVQMTQNFFEGDPDNDKTRRTLIMTSKEIGGRIGELCEKTLIGGDKHPEAAAIAKGLTGDSEENAEHHTLVAAIMWLCDGEDDELSDSK